MTEELDPADVQATFCATLVDEWARDGVVHAVICPGSRSTPLALALADRPTGSERQRELFRDCGGDLVEVTRRMAAQPWR